MVGYQYIPLTGDPGGLLVGTDVQFGEAPASIFEWVKAVQTNPRGCIGIGTFSWVYCYNDGDLSYNPQYTSSVATAKEYPVNDPNDLKQGYQASMLAYAAWSEYSKSLRNATYHSNFFVNCKYLQARNRQTWVKGSDY